MVKDINPGIGDSYLGSLTTMNNELYFYANDIIHGTELWKTDGTEAGTHIVKDINIGSGSGVTGPLVSNASSILFSGFDGTNFNLFASDGTQGGTIVLKEKLYATYAGSFGNNAYYIAINDSYTQYGLWKSDGTVNGTAFIKSFGTAIQNHSLPVTGRSTETGFYFIGTENVNGNELWKTDGTPAGTTMVKDINPGVASSDPYPMTAMGNRMVLTADNGLIGREPWITDGTDAGTFNLGDNNPGPLSCACKNFTIFNNEVYFSAYNSSSGYQLWKSDGTQAGTTMVKQLSQGIDLLDYGSITSHHGKLLFTASDPDHGVELWQLDSNGIHFFADLYEGLQSSQPGAFTTVNDSLFFRAFDKSGQRKIWISDGTVAHTRPLDLTPGLTITEEGLLPITYLNGLYLVSANSSIYGRELYSFALSTTVGGITENSEEITLYPNPGTGPFTIAGIASEAASVTLLDNSGRQVQRLSMVHTGDLFSFEMSSLPPGFYVAKISYGNQIAMRKVIVR
jgi:ELWxxDGT repeat protein